MVCLTNSLGVEFILDFGCHSSTAIYSCCISDVCSSILAILNDSCYGNPSYHHQLFCQDFEICICVNAFSCRLLLILTVIVTVTVAAIVIVILTETLTEAVTETESVICAVSSLRFHL